MGKSLYKFDMNALHVALDAERRARNLSWTELVDEINVPFQGTPSIPISISTIRSLHTKHSVTSAVVLQILGWLGRSPESFLGGRNLEPTLSALLPSPASSRILRFDTRALHAAVNAERAQRAMTWKQIAEELPGFTQSTLTNLANGPLIGFPRVMFLTQWLGQPAAHFVRACNR
jgi:hypothetical protein